VVVVRFLHCGVVTSLCIHIVLFRREPLCTFVPEEQLMLYFLQGRKLHKLFGNLMHEVFVFSPRFISVWTPGCVFFFRTHTHTHTPDVLVQTVALGHWELSVGSWSL
jgi:hypothetical protein